MSLSAPAERRAGRAQRARGKALSLTLTLALALLCACAKGSPPPPALPDDQFPSGFLFGTAIAGFQVDMGCPTLPRARCEDPNSDWYQWITDPRITAIGGLYIEGDPPTSGPGFYELYPQDLALATTALKSNALRLSIEWSRVFPAATFGVEGYDSLKAIASADALTYYHALFAAMKAKGLKPFVTLNHYTLPLWMHDGAACHFDLAGCTARGWLDPRIVEEIAKYAGFVAREFGGEVDLWATLNEPFSAVVLAGYLLPSQSRSAPPGLTLKWAEAKAALVTMMTAHARMADAVRANDTVDADGDGIAAQVGLVYNLQSVSPKDPNNPLDVSAARDLDYLENQVFLNGAVLGDVDENLDGDSVRHDDIAGRTDFIGINYYVRTVCEGLGASLFPAATPFFTFNPLSLELQMDPAGISEVLTSAAHYNLPLYISETGVPDAGNDGSNARPWIAETMTRVRRAIGRNVPVKGYFYWTLMDNYEWNHGMTFRDGFYRVDPGDATKARVPRASMIDAFSRIAATGKIPADLVVPR